MRKLLREIIALGLEVGDLLGLGRQVALDGGQGGGIGGGFLRVGKLGVQVGDFFAFGVEVGLVLNEGVGGGGAPGFGGLGFLIGGSDLAEGEGFEPVVFFPGEGELGAKFFVLSAQVGEFGCVGC